MIVSVVLSPEMLGKSPKDIRAETMHLCTISDRTYSPEVYLQKEAAKLRNHCLSDGKTTETFARARDRLLAEGKSLDGVVALARTIGSLAAPDGEPEGEIYPELARVVLHPSMRGRTPEQMRDTTVPTASRPIAPIANSLSKGVS